MFQRLLRRHHCTRVTAPQVPKPVLRHKATRGVDNYQRAAVATPIRAADSAISDQAATGPSSWVTGVVHTVHSPDELKDFLRTFQDDLVCLMCKARSCRPCKAFERKYAACAKDYRECVFLQIYGDETSDTRKLMISLQVKSTPTFMMFRHKGPVHTHSGISESKLRNALNTQLGRDGEGCSETDDT